MKIVKTSFKSIFHFFVINCKILARIIALFHSRLLWIDRFSFFEKQKKLFLLLQYRLGLNFFLVSLKFIDYSASAIIVVLSNPSVGSLLDLRYLSLYYQQGQRNYYQLLLLNPPLLDNEKDECASDPTPYPEKVYLRIDG